ncbi:Selenocysteine-specific elongation factor [Zancudomyces culisetae]|uniref:Selenocysteine-specific elongation factor n=1 Tax=Zancudomyces culisetae TaxID=1213189 RepID=A0A1R1PI33_ZANCU|nr:Selenocysteine-specific elongation factor [Zancudomyces culisetae]|eukprot:OMH80589.1 Selenocysteine-specific elongation factor [Zancudomyces culisetae]
MTSEKESIRNFSIGILGHVDSGKTSLGTNLTTFVLQLLDIPLGPPFTVDKLCAKVLSTKSSTAAFDKSPQSQDRGITLDVGFSSFEIVSDGDKKVEITIVDCPGHASLVRTVIGGWLLASRIL